MRTRLILPWLAIAIAACSGSGEQGQAPPQAQEQAQEQAREQTREQAQEQAREQAREQAQEQAREQHGEHAEPPAGHGGPHPWTLRSEEELSAAIESAKAEARSSGRRVLLDFGAPWCPDCREVARLSTLDPARATLAERYVVVHVDVGRWDRHRELLARYGIRRIATLVVLDPESGERLAQTTMEPISERSGLNAEGLAEWLRNPT